MIVNSQYAHNTQLGNLMLAAWHRPLANMFERYKDWLAHGTSRSPAALFVYGELK